MMQSISRPSRLLVGLLIILAVAAGGLFLQRWHQQVARRTKMHNMLGMLGKRVGSGWAIPPAYYLPYRDEAAPFLMQALQDSSRTPDARVHAALTLGVFRCTEAIPLLGQAAQDPEASVASAAAEALGTLGTPQAVQELLSLLDKSPQKAAVITALGKVQAPEARPKLLPLLDDSDSAIAGAAAVALGQIGGEGVAEALLKHLNQPSLRFPVTLGLIHLRHEKGIVSAVQIAASLKADQQQELIRALGQTGKEGVPLMLKALKKASGKGRLTLISALGRSRQPEAVEPLLQELHSKDLLVVGEAARALGKIGDSRAIAALIETLAHAHPQVRKLVEEGLMDLGAAAVDPLMEVLHSEDPAMRSEAVRTLGLLLGSLQVNQAEGWKQLQDKVAPALMEALKDPEASVRIQAAMGLGWMREARALSLLEQMAKEDKSSKARLMAQRAVQMIRVSQ